MVLDSWFWTRSAGLVLLLFVPAGGFGITPAPACPSLLGLWHSRTFHAVRVTNVSEGMDSLVQYPATLTVMNVTQQDGCAFRGYRYLVDGLGGPLGSAVIHLGGFLYGASLRNVLIVGVTQGGPASLEGNVAEYHGTLSDAGVLDLTSNAVLPDRQGSIMGRIVLARDEAPSPEAVATEPCPALLGRWVSPPYTSLMVAFDGLHYHGGANEMVLNVTWQDTAPDGACAFWGTRRLPTLPSYEGIVMGLLARTGLPGVDEGQLFMVEVTERPWIGTSGQAVGTLLGNGVLDWHYAGPQPPCLRNDAARSSARMLDDGPRAATCQERDRTASSPSCTPPHSAQAAPPPTRRRAAQASSVYGSESTRCYRCARMGVSRSSRPKRAPST